MLDSKIVYVSGSNDGDFNVTDDIKYKTQSVINNAINYVANHSSYTTVCLKGPYTYWINDTILLCSNLEFKGENGAKIKLVNKAGWKSYRPLIGPNDKKLKNIKIHDLEVDANHDGNFDSARGKSQIAPYVNKGIGYYNIMNFDSSSNIRVYNMYLHDGHGDGLRCTNCDDVQFYNNTVIKMGHDACFFLRSNNCHSYGNTVKTRTNTGSRMNDCTKSSIHDNDISCWADYWDAGGPGIQIERRFYKEISVDVYNNVIHNTFGPGMWIVKNSAAVKESGKSKINVYNNIFYECGINPNIYWVAGILIYELHNVNIYDNTFDNNYNAAIVCMGMTDIATASTKVKVYIDNNNITNTRKRRYSPNGTGYGIHNRLSSTHIITSSNNCLYNNTSGNYKNVGSTSDISKDPLYANVTNHDYHLKSTSGRWNGSEWVKDDEQSPCTHEAGTEIGRYNKTAYASKYNLTNTSDDMIVETSDSKTTLTSENEAINTPDTKTNYIKKIVQKSETIYPQFCNRMKSSETKMVLNSDTFIDIGSLDSTKYRGLVYFDLSKYNNLKIKSATLSLYWYYPKDVKRINDTIVELYRPSQYYASYVTWMMKNKSEKWVNSGGNWYDKATTIQGKIPYASITLKGNEVPTNKYYTMDVTSLVQAYVNDIYHNTGFLLKAKIEKDNYIAFYSGNMAATNKKMKMIIEYEDYV